jgi:hypothetical protein
MLFRKPSAQTVTAQEVADNIDRTTTNGLGGAIIRREENITIADGEHQVSGGRILKTEKNDDGDIRAVLIG